MDTIWIYLAMVAILGLRWFFEQLKKGAERRREMREGGYRRDQQYEQYEAEPQPTRTPPPIPTSNQPTPQPETTQPSVPQTLQELFEQRRQEIAKAQREAQRPAPQKPPPVEKPAPAPVAASKPKMSATPSEIELNSPFSIGGSGKKSKSKGGYISKTLSNKNTLRSALVLKEVLGKPKGFDL